MYEQVQKPKENQTRTVANSVAQKKSSAKQGFEFVDNRPESIAQRKLQEIANNGPQLKQTAQLRVMHPNHSFRQQQPIQKRKNNTGLPDNLKSGIENLSGYSMDDVKVHRNSDKPAQLQAHAYAQGTDIHLGSGQEKHLSHEAWHVVQQKQGRVKPTVQMKGKVNVNDNAGLENEANVMGARAMSGSQGTQTSELRMSKPSSGITQLAKWQWSKAKQDWELFQGAALKSKPTIRGIHDGQIYDDTPSFSPTISGKASSPALPPLYAPRGRTTTDAQYQAYLATLRTAKAAGQTLDPKQEQQLLMDSSNAQHLKEKVDHLATPAGQAGVPGEVLAWNGVLRDFQELPGNPVFTRDVDAGELSGQGHNGSTMSVADRVPRGIGRIRTFGDINRGGGAGSYVRFLADRPRNRPFGTPSASKPLNFGSIAGLGVTIVYDAKGVVADNSQPGGMAYNPQDSAGRVLGTIANSEAELMRRAKMSEKKLTESNPKHHSRSTLSARLNPKPVQNLGDDEIMRNAVDGMVIMRDQARDGQTDEEEYNEAVLFSGAKVSSTKAILIHRPPVGKGGIPERVPVAAADQVKMQGRQDKRFELIERNIGASESLIGILNKDRNLLLGTSKGNPAAKAELVRINGEISKEKKVLQKLKLQQRKPIPVERFFNKREVTTSSTLRNPKHWEDDSIPDEIKQWHKQTGHGGVPMKYLFAHVNPGKVTREQLPLLADLIWRSGKQRWEADKLRARQQATLEAHHQSQVNNMSIMGRSVGGHLRTVMRLRSPDTLKKHSDGDEAFAQHLLHQNNCLINAVSRAIHGIVMLHLRKSSPFVTK